MHRGDLGGAVLRQRRGWLSFSPSTMLALVASGDDAYAVLEQEERPRNMRSLGRHRVRHALEHDLGRGADEDRDTQRQRFRKHFDGTKTRELLAPPRFRNHA